MTFVLPWPPTTNHAYTVARGRKIKTQKARDYANEVAFIVADDLRTNGEGAEWTPTRDCRISVTIDLWEPDRRRRDIENHTKLALDAVFAQLGIDDSQIDRLELIRRIPDAARPRLVVKLERI